MNITKFLKFVLGIMISALILTGCPPESGPAGAEGPSGPAQPGGEAGAEGPGGAEGPSTGIPLLTQEELSELLENEDVIKIDEHLDIDKSTSPTTCDGELLGPIVTCTTPRCGICEPILYTQCQNGRVVKRLFDPRLGGCEDFSDGIPSVEELRCQAGVLIDCQ